MELLRFWNIFGRRQRHPGIIFQSQIKHTY